ncbi:MAG: type II toxin-antitoxin system prevent-host-death family antitoxin [Actinomycetota bacterium]
METMAISKFKATCLAVLERVRRTGQPVLITKRGEPVARVIPAVPNVDRRRTSFGSMEATFEILGDIVSPSGSEEDWEAGR